MPNSYKIAKELQGTSFDYGGIEELIGFITDNYYEAMAMYRAIVKQTKEADKKRDEAHAKLQKLRSDEEDWTDSGKFPDDFNAEEHEKRKDRFAELREKDYSIIYKGSPLPHDKLTHLIVHNMWAFDLLNSLDLGVRGQLGPLASKVLSKALWPMMKMMELTATHTESPAAEQFLTTQLATLQSAPEMISSKIVKP